MGLAGAMLPVAVKARFADRPGFATGVYTTGITLGSAVAAASRCRSRTSAGGWRTPLLVFGAVSTGARRSLALAHPQRAAAWRVDARPLKLPLRQPLAWRLVAAFFLMSSVFYGLNAWLPDAYVERGWSESWAGALLAVLNTVTIPIGFAVAWAADHWGTRRIWLGGAARVQLGALLGVVLLPGARLAAGRCCSASAIGPLFPLTMTLPLDARRPAGRGRGARRDDARRRLHALRARRRSCSARSATRPAGSTPCSGRSSALAALLVVVDCSFSPARLAAGRHRDRRRR